MVQILTGVRMANLWSYEWQGKVIVLGGKIFLTWNALTLKTSHISENSVINGLRSKHGYPAAGYRGADKSLAPPTSRCILFDGENISLDVNLVIYTNSTNIPPIMIINKIT